MEENNIHTCSYMSGTIDQIATALSEFQGSLEQPKLEKEVNVKTRTGSGYSFKYADLSACVKAATPALKANGLAIVQLISDGCLVTMLTHKSGQWFKSVLRLPQQTADYQSYGSAITYLKRYSYCAILGIVADTDDDANAAMGNQATFKDTRSAQNSAANMQTALNDLQAAKTLEDAQNVWLKWQNSDASICANGSAFYNAVAEKIQKLRAQ